MVNGKMPLYFPRTAYAKPAQRYIRAALRQDSASAGATPLRCSCIQTASGAVMSRDRHNPVLRLH